jgi:hypothetical protein
MRKTYIFSIFALLVLFLASCTTEQQQVVTIQPFIGGNDALIISFDQLRKEVFDGGNDPFDVIIKIQNKGETDISKSKARVKLSGVKPQEFGRSENDFIKIPESDIESRKKDATGGVIETSPHFVSFKDLNHATAIQGNELAFPLRADVCYLYATKVVSKLCVRNDLLSTTAGGVCNVNEAKPVFNSGAPLQVTNVQQSAVGKDKLRISFEIKKPGSGEIYRKESNGCELTRDKNKVHVRVDAGMEGLSCTGFDVRSGKGVEGDVTLYDGTKIITCDQQINQKGDYETELKIDLSYDHLQSATEEIKVRHAPE